jgi:pimeloyl-ACP methyl ester carboxylesterase
MDQHQIAGSPPLALHHVPAPDTGGPRGHLLFVHGTTFPTLLAAGWPLGPGSWMDDLAAAGFDAWGLDFAGHGASGRYPEQASGDPAGGPPLGRAPDDAEQIGRAVDYIAERSDSRVSLVAHSRGTMPAALYACRHPERVASLVMVAPILRRELDVGGAEMPATFDVTLDWQWQRFVQDVPAGEEPPFARAEFDRWADAYLRTDPDAFDRDPPSVRIPAGSLADIQAAFGGDLPYDPSRIRPPMLVVHGEWDSLCTDDDVAWLIDRATSAAATARALIPRASHIPHLEANRHHLYRAVAEFLLGVSTQPSGKELR